MRLIQKSGNINSKIISVLLLHHDFSIGWFWLCWVEQFVDLNNIRWMKTWENYHLHPLCCFWCKNDLLTCWFDQHCLGNVDGFFEVFLLVFGSFGTIISGSQCTNLHVWLFLVVNKLCWYWRSSSKILSIDGEVTCHLPESPVWFNVGYPLSSIRIVKSWISIIWCLVPLFGSQRLVSIIPNKDSLVWPKVFWLVVWMSVWFFQILVSYHV